MYLKLTNPDKTWVLDIEADSLTPTVIWCVIVKNYETKEVLVFTEKEKFNTWLGETKEAYFIGHNILTYDVPNLNRLWGSGINLNSCVDTLVLSYLYNPGMPDGHSLDAWGERLKFPKGIFNDFSKLSEQMLSYCRQDVELTYRVYKALVKKMLGLGYSELSCEIEHKIKIIIDEQIRNGVWFAYERAKDFSEFLRREQARLSDQIQRLFPPCLTEVKRYTFRRLKDGSPFAQYGKALQKYDLVTLLTKDGVITTNEADAVEYDVWENKTFNLGSPSQRIERLKGLGWEPVSFTPKGSPKIDEDALLAYSLSLPDGPQREGIRALAEWLVIQGRLTMLAGNPKTGSKGWLGNVTDHGNGNTRIHGKVFSCAAATRRMIHNNPNTGNIPSAHKAKYGKECRSFWGVEPNRGLVLVGYDAAGLETAGLCHYLNNPKATEILLRPKPHDIHTANSQRLSEALKRPIDREWGAKTSWYAWLYGAYPPKLGQIVKGPPRDGEIVIDTFFRNVPGLKKLIDGVQYEFRTNSGRLETIDGGFVLCPSSGAALNYKIQSLGSILMKLTSILLDERAREQGIPFKKALDVHDEGQLETEEKYGDVLGKLAVSCIEEAGRKLKLNVQVTGDYKIGIDWSLTH